MRQIYIAGCVFTVRYPELSFQIQNYMERCGMEVVRCCVPRYRLREFTDQMPQDRRDSWSNLPDSTEFNADCQVYSICHNCSAILEEWKPDVSVKSIWEWILEDTEFLYPDHRGMEVVLQDCWRAYDRRSEQNAVRELLQRMNIRIIELPDHYEKTAFCGNSLYRPAPVRNLKLAPARFVEGAKGLFAPHSIEEQKRLMECYCQRFQDRQVVAYCHYCTEGLSLGEAHAVHLAELLFKGEES